MGLSLEILQGPPACILLTVTKKCKLLAEPGYLQFLKMVEYLFLQANA